MWFKNGGIIFSEPIGIALMIKQLRTLQWNIGGAKIQAAAGEPYDKDGLNFIASKISEFQPDIVTLQETHSNDGFIQPKELANRLGWEFFVNDVYASSHIENGQKLGQAILSRWPIHDHSFSLLPNPEFKLLRPDGEVWLSHDKGVTRLFVDAQGLGIEVCTLHLVPFRKFNVDFFDKNLLAMRDELTKSLSSGFATRLIQGDFNIDVPSLQRHLPQLLSSGCKEFILPTPTTPTGRFYDHVVYKNLTLCSANICSDVPTDHYPVICDFTIT